MRKVAGKIFENSGISPRVSGNKNSANAFEAMVLDISGMDSNENEKKRLH